MKTAVIYARYSSERQTEQSIEGQLRECMTYAEHHDMMVVDTYIDRAMTGTNDNRNDFQRMLKDAQKKAWDVVLVYKLDRFSRNKYEMAIHKKTLRDYGISLVSAKEHIPEGPEGIILESLLEGMAEYYSAELAQKVSRGLRETRIKGNYAGGGITYGYEVVKKKFQICETEAPVVIRIYEMYAAGVIVKNIIKTLTDEGIMYRNGRPFGKSVVYGILQNERYSGVYTHKTEGTYTNTFPRIVPQHLFETVHLMVSENRYGKHPEDVVYLLRNKLKCGYCGKSVTSESGTSRNGTVVRYYKCSTRKKDSTKCHKAPIRKEILEQLIVDTTVKVLDNPETIDMIANRVFDAHENRLRDTAVINILEAERDRIRKALDNMLHAVEQGIITISTKQRIEELEAALEVAEGKVLIEKSKDKVQITHADIKKFIRKVLKKEPRPIIEPEEWDRVQIELARRKASGKATFSNSPFSTKIFCGDCGARYTPITWHSTDKYRRLIWQCIDKFHNEVKCTTTHLIEPQLKEKFLEMFAIYFADRKATLDTLRYVQKTLTDTDFIDEDIADSEREMDLLTEMIRQTVMQNASASVTEDEYRRRYNALTARFRAEEEKHKRLTERRKRMAAESVAIGGMLVELTELEAPPIEFDEKLWHAVVDRVTVYNDDRLVYSLKDGSEITVML